MPNLLQGRNLSNHLWNTLLYWTIPRYGWPASQAAMHLYQQHLCSSATNALKPDKQWRYCSVFQNSIMKLQTQWVYLPRLPLNDCRGERQRNRWERGEKERKVSDNGTVCDVYQIYYNPVLLILNTEFRSRDSYNRNLILKVVEYQKTHNCTHSHSRLQPYEIALFDVACNLKHMEGKLYRLRGTV